MNFNTFFGEYRSVRIRRERERETGRQRETHRLTERMRNEERERRINS